MSEANPWIPLWDSNPAPGTKKSATINLMLPFRFQNQIIYERLRSFAKQIYTFSGSLPVYEQPGLISQLRSLSTSLLEDLAEGFVRTPKTDPLTGLDHCLVNVAKIAALADLCHQLGYTDNHTRENIINTCDELTKHLYEAKKMVDK